MDATIVVVGDEILAGHVRDANGHFIASRLAATGHRLRRVSVVPDEPDQIATALRHDVALIAPELVFVCGGLGPTHDDRTMEGVAAALELPLRPCPPIAQRVRDVLAGVTGAGFPAAMIGAEGLEKMALAPAGAEVLPVPGTLIPAVTLEHRNARYFVLPGPPRELRLVMTEAVEPRYLVPTGSPLRREEIEHQFPESSLAAALAAIGAAFPEVSLGSYPLRDRVLIRVAGPDADARDAAGRVRDAIALLESSDEGQRLLEFLKIRRRG